MSSLMQREQLHSDMAVAGLAKQARKRTCEHFACSASALLPDRQSHRPTKKPAHRDGLPQQRIRTRLRYAPRGSHLPGLCYALATSHYPQNVVQNTFGSNPGGLLTPTKEAIPRHTPQATSTMPATRIANWRREEGFELRRSDSSSWSRSICDSDFGPTIPQRPTQISTTAIVNETRSCGISSILPAINKSSVSHRTAVVRSSSRAWSIEITSGDLMLMSEANARRFQAPPHRSGQPSGSSS